MSGNSCESALQTAPIVSDLPPCGGPAGAVGAGLRRGIRDLGRRGRIGVALGHGLGHRAR